MAVTRATTATPTCWPTSSRSRDHRRHRLLHEAVESLSRFLILQFQSGESLGVREQGCVVLRVILADADEALIAGVQCVGVVWRLLLPKYFGNQLSLLGGPL